MEPKKLDQYGQSECSCIACKACCLSSPCLGTPDDIKRIEDAGYENLSETYVYDIIVNRLKKVRAITGISWEANGKPMMKCSMLTEKGLCKLHDSGLKPTEGKIIGCHHSTHDTQVIRHELLKSWDSKELTVDEVMQIIQK
jgi:hypothetical protein